MMLFHSQNMKQAKFFFSLFHEKTVGIKEKNQRKQPNNYTSELHGKSHGSVSYHIA